MMITYEQRPFVAQALESALEQRTDFEFEVVVGEDASRDGTAEVVRDYARRHPGRIRALYRPENVGMGRNFVSTFDACRGEYVAVLEGDDYWTSPSKLQRQVAAMEAHPEWALSFHPASWVYEDSSRPAEEYPPRPRPPMWTLDDLLRWNFITTCSVMYRRRPEPLPAWFADLAPLDWPTHVLHALEGQIGWLDEPMSVYRVHGAGAWGAKGAAYQREQTAHMLQELRARLGNRLGRRRRDRLGRTIVAFKRKTARELCAQAARGHARSYVATEIRKGLRQPGFPLGRMVRLYLQVALDRRVP